MIRETRCDFLTFPGIKSATTFTVAISHTRHPLSSEVAAKYAESKLCPRFKHNNFQTSHYGAPFSWHHNLRLVNITLKEHKITFLKEEGKPYISVPLLSDFAYSLKLCKMLPNVNSKKGHLMSRSWIDLKAFGSSKMSTKLGHWKTRTCPSYTSTCFLLYIRWFSHMLAKHKKDLKSSQFVEETGNLTSTCWRTPQTRTISPEHKDFDPS